MNLPRAELEAVVHAVMAEVLRRSQDGPWVDTKLDTIDGSELHHDGPIDLFGPPTVYAWIQGRAVEALALHARWFAGRGEGGMAEACIALARRTATALEAARTAAGGRLWFWLDRSGKPFVLDVAGRAMPWRPDPRCCTFSDLFHARGLQALALVDRSWSGLARERRLDVLAALREDRFVSDQQVFDPRNRVGEVPGRRSFGVHMIAIGLCALGVEGDGGAGAVADGLALVDGVLAGHANRAGRWPQLPPDTLCEFISADGSPWREAGQVIGDPGHACELVGLAAWLCLAARDRGHGAHRIPALLPELGAILRATASYGLRGQGMCKHWSLSEHRPVNDDQPWWSLPETMRAAALLRDLGFDTERLLTDCAARFLRHYVNPAVHGWAVQTLDPQGTPVRRIPATPDADPGYHTGTCLIQVLAGVPTAIPLRDSARM
jgi:hypothetical protein